MGITLNDFKNNLKDAARPNRFLLSFTSPFGGASGEEISYLVKSSQIPGRNLGEIILNWQGMQAKIAGDPTWDDLTVTFINDYDFKARKTIEQWMERIANSLTNERGEPGEYQTDIYLKQLGRKGEVIAEYVLRHAYPKTLNQIDLSMDNTDQIEEFDVTFGYEFFEKIS